jgi:hypothetical protein
VPERKIFPLLTTPFFVLASAVVYHVGVYDYANNSKLYSFIETTPKNSLIVGHPDIMDNVITFSRRKAFLTYGLSHTWYVSYWNVIKKRTFDFCRAYYAEDPNEIRLFCRRNGINFLVVRDSDFSAEHLTSGGLYFEPFGSYIWYLTRLNSSFALLDRKMFPPIYEKDGIRVIATYHELDADQADQRPLAFRK